MGRAARRPGAQPRGHQRRREAGAGRRGRALHRRRLADRPGAAPPPRPAASPRPPTRASTTSAPRAPRWAWTPGPNCRRCPASSGRARSPRRARSRWRGTATAPPRTRRAATRTTTPAAWSPAVPCRAAGTPSRGGVPRWSPAPGAWALPCCSPRCSAAWPVVAYADGFADGAAADGMDGGMDGGDAGGDLGGGGRRHRGRLGWRRLRRRRLRRRRLLLIRRDRPET